MKDHMLHNSSFEEMIWVLDELKEWDYGAGNLVEVCDQLVAVWRGYV